MTQIRKPLLLRLPPLHPRPTRLDSNNSTQGRCRWQGACIVGFWQPSYNEAVPAVCRPDRRFGNALGPPTGLLSEIQLSASAAERPKPNPAARPALRLYSGIALMFIRTRFGYRA